MKRYAEVMDQNRTRTWLGGPMSEVAWTDSGNSSEDVIRLRTLAVLEPLTCQHSP